MNDETVSWSHLILSDFKQNVSFMYKNSTSPDASDHSVDLIDCRQDSGEFDNVQ